MSWNQQLPFRNRKLSEEDGEIHIEEGEVSSPSRPSFARNTSGGPAAVLPQPPPPLPQQQPPLPPPPPPPPPPLLQQQQRRATWGTQHLPRGGGAAGSVGAAGGRGFPAGRLGQRHSSFSGIGAQPPPKPHRSTSFTNFKRATDPRVRPATVAIEQRQWSDDAVPPPPPPPHQVPSQPPLQRTEVDSYSSLASEPLGPTTDRDARVDGHSLDGLAQQPEPPVPRSDFSVRSSGPDVFIGGGRGSTGTDSYGGGRGTGPEVMTVAGRGSVPETYGTAGRGDGYQQGGRGGPNRRGNDFNFRGDLYYGPNDAFRRSPPQRGRPLFRGGAGPAIPAAGRGPNVGRGFNFRKQDPRYAPDAVRSFEDDSFQQSQQHPFVSQPQQPFFRKQESVDAFGRARDWSKPSSPQGSPQSRRSITTVASASPTQVQSTAASDKADTIENLPTPPPLLTTCFGDHAERAENAVGVLSTLLGNSALKGDTASELPDKQLIFRALAVMDTKIKNAQNEFEEREAQIVQTKQEEEREKLRANEQVILEERQRQDERIRRYQARYEEAEKTHEREVQAMIMDRKAEFDTALEKSATEYESRLQSMRSGEEAKRQTVLAQQIIAAAEGFDQEIAKARHDLEKAISQARKSEIKISQFEAEYESKLKHLDSEREVKGHVEVQDVVSKVLADNRKRATEAHLLQSALVTDDECQARVAGNETATDPKEGLTIPEWSWMATQVTGFADALYSEPAEAPYFESNDRIHEMIAPLVKEYIRYKRQRLHAHWSTLAEEYEYRRKVYDREHKGALAKMRKRASSVVRHSMLGKPGMPILESTCGRSSSNPYRRARRGNEVRSEYEQEQIIAELAAKEAMEKKIEFGGSKLPRHIGVLEREVTACFFNTFTSQQVDVLEQEADLAITNVWSDMEKCIFLDRFMQFPKDFRKISSFLRNKTTKDCVCFYYDSKQTVPYKAALKEHIMRRKRRGDFCTWDATIEAAISCGAVVEAGESEDKPLVFLLPNSDHTYHTKDFHPMKFELFDALEIDGNALRAGDDEPEVDEPRRPGRPRKRPRDPLFFLGPEQRKYLRPSSAPLKISQSRSSLAETDVTDGNGSASETGGDTDRTPTRRVPQKWTNGEKKIFIDTLEKHGRNWVLLSEAVGTKSIAQIKNFYYDYKKHAGRGRLEKRPGKPKTREDDSATPPPESGVTRSERPADASLGETPVPQELLFSQFHTAEPVAPDVLLSQQSRMGPQGEESLTSAERWIQTLQAQSLFNLSQHHQQSQVEEVARRLLQHHSHTQHQQVVSNLFPFLHGAGSHNIAAASANNISDWNESAQQLRNLLQASQSQQHISSLLAALASAPLPSLAGSGLAGGLDASTLHLLLAQQSRPHHQRHNSGVEALVQHIMALQGGQDNSISSNDALALLQRALGNDPRSQNFHGRDKL